MESRCIDCRITAATDPRTVLQDGTAYDLAFLDIQMDGIDGITLAKAL